MKKQILLLLLVVLGSMAQAQIGNRKIISREEQLNEEYCSSLFKTSHGTILDLTDNTAAQGYGNILYWLQGRVAGLDIYTSRNGVAVPYIRNQRATVYLDEMPVSFSTINMIPSSDIAMIKIIKSGFAGNMMYGSGGAIAIYTLKGEDDEDN